MICRPPTIKFTAGATRLPPGQPNSRLSKIHWRTLRGFLARVSPDPNPVRHSKFLTAGQALTPRKIICHRTLAAYVGDTVTIRYDPRDMAEFRVFTGAGFLCRAICPELAGTTISLKDITAARNARRRGLARACGNAPAS